MLPELWKAIVFDASICDKNKYEVSNYGKVRCYSKKHPKGRFVKQNVFQGYYRIELLKKSGTKTARYVHKLVAEAFLEKKQGQRFVLHLNYEKGYNRVWNLAWATLEEKTQHHLKNPAYKNKTMSYSKEKIEEIRLLKQKILDPNRTKTLKQIAKEYNISEMQVHRIKTGENWGYVKIK